MGFTKLDEKILQSSIMAENPSTFKIWISLLAACKESGVAYVSPIYLSTVCHLPLENVKKAIHKLSEPDELSRSLTDDGRRIRRVDGGFEIINYHVYRAASLRSAEAERKRLYRKEQKECPDKTGRRPDASASASASLNKIEFKERSWVGITEEDKKAWAAAYPACNIEIELKGMIEWIISNPAKGKKSNYRRFITGWLKREQDKGGSFRGRGIKQLEPERDFVKIEADMKARQEARDKELGITK